MSTLRSIVINQSTGAPEQTIESIAKTWGELKRELSEAGISYNGLKAIVGETRTTLESDKSQLPPEGIFNLYLLPTKTKSGMSTKKVKSDTLPNEPVTKSKKAPAKKAPVKKEAASKKEAPSKVKSSLKEAAEAAVKATEKEMTDIDIITSSMNSLKNIKNLNVQTKLNSLIIELDDLSYIIATGRPRIDNLRQKKDACTLMQDGNLNLQNKC